MTELEYESIKVGDIVRYTSPMKGWTIDVKVQSLHGNPRGVVVRSENAKFLVGDAFFLGGSTYCDRLTFTTGNYTKGRPVTQQEFKSLTPGDILFRDKENAWCVVQFKKYTLDLMEFTVLDSGNCGTLAGDLWTSNTDRFDYYYFVESSPAPEVSVTPPEPAQPRAPVVYPKGLHGATTDDEARLAYFYGAQWQLYREIDAEKRKRATLRSGAFS